MPITKTDVENYLKTARTVREDFEGLCEAIFITIGGEPLEENGSNRYSRPPVDNYKVEPDAVEVLPQVLEELSQARIQNIISKLEWINDVANRMLARTTTEASARIDPPPPDKD
jgi:hypothetical protein